MTSFSSSFPRQTAINRWGRIFPFLILFFVVLAELPSGSFARRVVSLNSDWTLWTEYQNITIPKQSIPIGTYSALENNGFVGPVYESFNDVNLRWIARRNWTFHTEFPSPTFEEEERDSTVFLTFFGIDTVSTILLNGQVIGKTDNMFVRYQFDVTGKLLRDGNRNNSLVVEIANPIKAASDASSKNSFTPPNCPPAPYHGECHMNFLRKMQASFAWDWGLAAPSSGIWKDVQLEIFLLAHIRDVTVQMQLKEDKHWHVHFDVHLETGHVKGIVQGQLEVLIPAIEDAKVTQSIDSESDYHGALTVGIDLVVAEEKVELWWPNGFGAPTLYTVNVTFTLGEAVGGAANEKDTKTLRIGFRTINLIQEPIGTGLSFFFEVNGHPIFMKGSNWIPSDVLPERAADQRRVRHLLKAARDANMNMLRVWGGGIYESDFFYDLADEYGILIWQDLMFACAMYPVHEPFLESVTAEVKQNVRRLQHHASIAIYATNNENEVALVQNWYGTNREALRFRDEYRKLYIDVVKRTVEENDKWRTCLSSSPSNGLKTVEDNYISANPQDTTSGDIHYYNYMADAWNSNIYPKPRFVSEYGFQSYPSLSSWAESAGGNDFLPELMQHRQHSPLGEIPILTLINRHLPLEKVSAEEAIAAKIYFSQIGQAMAIKTETELYRTLRGSFANTMGALYWQLNDVWVAPSWSSIDFHGKFKILHHFARKFFEPTSIVPIVNSANVVDVHVVNDVLLPSGGGGGGKGSLGKATLRLFNWKDLQSRELMSWGVEMVPNSAMKLDSVPLWSIFNATLPANEHFLRFTLTDASDRLISSNFVFPTPLKDVQGLSGKGGRPEVTVASDSCDGFEQKLVLSVRTAAPILFFYVDILNEGVKEYQLSDNGFVIVDPVTTLSVTYPNVDCNGARLVLEDVRVYTVNQYMN